jgi:hypothetical protein
MIILVGFFTVSCEDYFDAPAKSSLDEGTIFSTPALAWGTVAGIYNNLAQTNAYRGRWLCWYGFNTDVEWYGSSTSTSDDRAKMTGYDLASTNSQMNTDNNTWAQAYGSIERANIAIRGLRSYGNPLPGTELGHILGEVLTLRALIYYDLVRTHGDVPARFEPISTETLYVSKSDRDVVYKQIIADLLEAEELVDWPGSTWTKTVEHVNKAFVKGLRARICLNACGYSQRPDGIRRSTDPELAPEVLLPIVKQECLDVINSKTCVLEPSFENVFKKLCGEDLTAGGESLYELPFADGRGRVAYTFAIRHTGSTGGNQFLINNWGGTAGPLPNVFYDFDVADTRRDVTCIPYEWNGGSVAKDELIAPAAQRIKSFNSWCFGKLRFEWMKRYITSSNDDGINKQYMRYSEIYLMLAEALNELEGPSAAAPYLKEVRKRAFPESVWASKVDSYVSSLSTKEAMFNAIVDENAYEFTGEMLRKEQLIRWNLLKTKMDEAKTKMYALRAGTGEYADVNRSLYYYMGSYPAVNDRFSGTYENTAIAGFYGLNHGETGEPSASFLEKSGGSVLTEQDWISESKLTDEKIESLYLADPNTRQYWPIWQVFIDASNGTLTNDYGY